MIFKTLGRPHQCLRDQPSRICSLPTQVVAETGEALFLGQHDDLDGLLGKPLENIWRVPVQILINLSGFKAACRWEFRGKNRQVMPEQGTHCVDLHSLPFQILRSPHLEGRQSEPLRRIPFGEMSPATFPSNVALARACWRQSPGFPGT